MCASRSLPKRAASAAMADRSDWFASPPPPEPHHHAAVSFLGSGSGPSFVQFIRHFIRTAPQKNVHTLLLTSDVTSDAQCDTQWEHHAASRDAQRAGGKPLGGRIVELHADAAAAAATSAAAPPE